VNKKILVHIEVGFFLYGKGKTGDAVVKVYRPHGKYVFVYQGTSEREIFSNILPGKAGGGREAGAVDSLWIYFRDLKRKRVSVNQVPRVSLKFPLHTGKNTGRAKKSERLIAGKEEAQEVVKTNEVVHVTMGDKDVGYLKNFGWGQRVITPEVEEHASALPAQVDTQARITKGAVNKPGGKSRLHCSDAKGPAGEDLRW
jgi:hypothetical protein